jgi:hypothetical protein
MGVSTGMSRLAVGAAVLTSCTLFTLILIERRGFFDSSPLQVVAALIASSLGGLVAWLLIRLIKWIVEGFKTIQS